jgi:spermidine/putrescine ABC transporter ATP-binding subunit
VTDVTFERLSKHYGAVRAVDDVSLTVKSGEFATILGPSGSGKTTMLSMIAGITQPTAGTIRIGGRDITRVRTAERNIGLVFQSYALFPHMNVTQNIAFPLKLRKLERAETEAKVAQALALVRLEGYEARKPRELSGGQQQRVALARAIVFNPDILLLDEPLAALDRKLREEVRTELHQLQRQLGITTIMVTHDQDEALSLSDRIVVLNEGRVQQVGTPMEAYHRPQNRFVAEFLGLANFLEGDFTKVEGNGFIRLSDGALAPCHDTTGRMNGQVCGLLRPEDVSFAEAKAKSGIPARVLDSAFFGDEIRYSVETGGGSRWVVRVDKTQPSHPEGSQVRLTWNPQSVWALPGDSE